MQVDPIKPMLKPPGTKRLRLEYDGLLSNFGFKFNLRRHTEAMKSDVVNFFYGMGVTEDKVGRCRLTLSNPL